MPVGLAAATIGSAAIGAGANALASSSAAKKQSAAALQAAKLQTDAANRAADIQLGMFGQVRQDLSPYRQFGEGALPILGGLLGTGYTAPPAAATSASGLSPQMQALVTGGGQQGDWGQYLAQDPGIAQQFATLSQGWKQANGVNSLEDFARWHWNNKGQGEQGRFNPFTGGAVGVEAPQAQAAPAQTGMPGGSSVQSFLENTPGYQFTRDQGLKAVSNSVYAKGLGGPSGALGKGLSRFVTGLADQTYGNQVDRYMKAAGIGQNAAAQTAQSAGSAAQGIASSITGAGQAAASGITGAANAGAAGTIATGNAIGQIAGAIPGAVITNKVLGMYQPVNGAPTFGGGPQAGGGLGYTASDFGWG